MINRLSAFFALAVASVFAVLALAPSAPAAARPVPNMCHLVAKADYNLCQQVRRQMAYAYVTKGGNLVQMANGNTLVRSEVVNAGLTKPEMHSALVGYARDYAKHANRNVAVVVDIASLRNAYGTDAQYNVGFEDVDGKPGGKKAPRVDLDLP